jgi:hypothetical protein
MQAHIIENGVVINTIVVDSLDFMAGLIEAPEGTGIGWSYVNGQFVDNRPKPEVVAPPAPTKEQLLAQLNARCAAQIQALE